MFTIGSKRACAMFLAAVIGVTSLSSLAQEGPTDSDRKRYQRYLAKKNKVQLENLQKLAGKDVPLELFLWRLEKQGGITLGGGGTTDPIEPPPQPPTKK